MPILAFVEDGAVFRVIVLVPLPEHALPFARSFAFHSDAKGFSKRAVLAFPFNPIPLVFLLQEYSLYIMHANGTGNRSHSCLPQLQDDFISLAISGRQEGRQFPPISSPMSSLELGRFNAILQGTDTGRKESK